MSALTCSAGVPGGRVGLGGGFGASAAGGAGGSSAGAVLAVANQAQARKEKDITLLLEEDSHPQPPTAACQVGLSIGVTLGAVTDCGRGGVSPPSLPQRAGNPRPYQGM